MTEAMPFLQKYDITFLRPPPITPGGFFYSSLKGENCTSECEETAYCLKKATAMAPGPA